MSQQPTFSITKEHFVGVINSLHAQFVKDKECSAALGQFFNAEISGYYDNSALINSIFSFLHEVFPKDGDGHCEIEHYAYVCNFGKIEGFYESPEELFDRLNALKFNVKLDLELWESRRNVREYPVAPEDAFVPGLPSLTKACTMDCDALTVGTGRCGCKINKADLSNRCHDIYSSEKAKSDRTQFVKSTPDETA